jgi:hypothetical protein
MVVDMLENEVKIPLVSAIVNEYEVQFLVWGNYNNFAKS